MGVFQNINKVKSTQGGNYVEPGNYLFEIQRCKEQDSQANSSVKFFVAELKVLEAQQTNDDVKPNGVGTEPSWLVQLTGTKYPDLALGNVKAFLHAAYGALAAKEGEEPPEEDEIGEDAAELAISEENPLAGVRITGKAFYKKTREGNNFTRVKWGIPDNVE